MRGIDSSQQVFKLAPPSKLASESAEVGSVGFEPTIQSYEDCVFRSNRCLHSISLSLLWKPVPESNRGIAVLQTAALPLGEPAMVDLAGIEPATEACKATVLPLAPQAHT